MIRSWSWRTRNQAGTGIRKVSTVAKTMDGERRIEVDASATALMFGREIMWRRMAALRNISANVTGRAVVFFSGRPVTETEEEPSPEGPMAAE